MFAPAKMILRLLPESRFLRLLTGAIAIMCLLVLSFSTMAKVVQFCPTEAVISQERVEDAPMTNHPRVACVYAYYEKNNMYRENFRYFLEHAILPHVDYYIVLSSNSSVSLRDLPNIKYLDRPNAGLDFGSHAVALATFPEIVYAHSLYFFINTSVRGPFLGKFPGQDWVSVFAKLFNNDTALVGLTVNYQGVNGERNPHIQSMFFGLDRRGMAILQGANIFNEFEINNMRKKMEVVEKTEVRMSELILSFGFNIGPIVQELAGLDYRTIQEDPNTSKGDPWYQEMYFGRNLEPNETVFFKTNRRVPMGRGKRRGTRSSVLHSQNQ